MNIAMLVKCDSEKAEKLSNSSHVSTTQGFKVQVMKTVSEFCNSVFSEKTTMTWLLRQKDFDDMYSTFHTTSSVSERNYIS